MKNPVLDNISALMCTNCKSSIWDRSPSVLKCRSCGRYYQILDDEKVITTTNYIPEKKWEFVSDGFNLFKGNEKPIKIDKLGGPRISDLQKSLKIKGLTLNLGSGQDNYHGMINMDLGIYAPVHIVADLTNIPLANDSIELVVSNSVLEHIYDYKLVIDEVYRVMSKKGYFYLCVPNACLRHHKYDFHRWTTPGLHKLFEGRFEIIDSGACRGVAYAIVTYVEALLAYKIKNKVYLSLSRSFWRIISRPLFMIRDDSSEEYQAMSQTIYVLGRKL